MAKRPSTTIPKYRRRRSRSPISWTIAFLFKLVFGLLLFSILWVLLYRFVPPPTTATMLGDLFAGRGATRDWMPIGQIDRDEQPEMRARRR